MCYYNDLYESCNAFGDTGRYYDLVGQFRKVTVAYHVKT